MSEALVQYAHPPISPDADCAACGATGRLMRDHCHEHGWIRGIVCDQCNKWLARVDRRFSPQVDETLLAALLVVRNRCPDCERLEVADLKCRTRRDAARATGAAFAARTGTQVAGTIKARRNLRGLLDEVEHHDVHVTILRYDKPAAVLVSPEWYEQAKALIGAARIGARQAEQRGETP